VKTLYSGKGICPESFQSLSVLFGVMDIKALLAEIDSFSIGSVGIPRQFMKAVGDLIHQIGFFNLFQIVLQYTVNVIPFSREVGYGFYGESF
jgi:hypothetical protein